MKQVFWSATALVSLVVVCSVVEGRSVVKRDAPSAHIDPHLEVSLDFFFLITQSVFYILHNKMFNSIKFMDMDSYIRINGS